MRKHAPSWAAFDVRMMFQGYLERGFVAENGDAATLKTLLGREPRAYEDFAYETLGEWQKPADSRAAAQGRAGSIRAIAPSAAHCAAARREQSPSRPR